MANANKDSFTESVRGRIAHLDNAQPSQSRPSAAADANRSGQKKKGFWARHTDRLKNTNCTITPPECR